MALSRFVLPLLLWGSSALALLAQDAECFIQDAKGRKIDLSNICGKTPPPSPRFVSVPIKDRRGNTPVIAVTFNGKQTFDMILDTGATGTVITQEMANLLNVRPFTAVKAQVADGSTVVFPIGFVQSISVSGATVNNVPVAIAPQMQLGLLGNDFLSSYDVKIKRDTIELYQRP
ncbi:MAG: retropepsin-like aspartic protease [Pseudanabaenaceae cyanobacterium SKYGB_i_bin29]|nr:retroviral-like aspartic protease family protein [Pseudanabaenaceae cyanobacterium SKYG29]MDW8422058.1 retropepsin-like aspartic protease [Pseudanabaenaceae cyanobacterium SKYGB_i_bin29]